MEANDAAQQDRRRFLQAAGVAATTVALAGLPSAARGTSEATGKMKIENVGVMSPGDMGQAVALQIKAKGLHVYTALEHRSERTRGLAREAGSRSACVTRIPLQASAARLITTSRRISAVPASSTAPVYALLM